jgi:hypothetical protein
MLFAGRIPKDMSTEEIAVYKLARRLAGGRRQLSDQEGVLAIAHVVGGLLSNTTLGSVAGWCKEEREKKSMVKRRKMDTEARIKHTVEFQLKLTDEDDNATIAYVLALLLLTPLSYFLNNLVREYKIAVAISDLQSAHPFIFVT